jgi:hypothetical protein
MAKKNLFRPLNTNVGEEINLTDGKKKTKRKNVQIVYPIFYECGQKMQDTFWKDLFFQAAIGKFPRGFMYKDLFLTYKHNKKIFKRQLPNTVDELIPVFKTFFNEYAGIMSTQDQELYHTKYENCVQELNIINENQTWTSVSKKKIRDNILYQWQIEQAKLHNLNKQQRIQLSSLLHYGFITGAITSDDIFIDNNVISDIASIEWKTDHYELNRDPKIIQTRPTIEKSFKIVDDISYVITESDDYAKIDYQWTKFLDSLEKKNLLSNHSESEVTEGIPTIQSITLENIQTPIID